MAATGVLLGLAVLVLMAVRGINVLVAALLGAALVAVTNDKLFADLFNKSIAAAPANELFQSISKSLVDALTKDFVGSMMGFAGQFILVFLMGAIFGRVMGESKAAASVAYSLSRWLGAERVMYILTLACVLLTYGGVNVFIVIFTIFPLGLSLMQHANLPKRLLVGPITLGSGTFTMTALPGSPSVQNIIAAQGLQTPVTSAPIIGLLAALLMFAMGMYYLERQRRLAKQRGEEFRPGLTDVIPEQSTQPGQMPHPLVSLIPIVVVLLTIMIPVWTIAVGYGGGVKPEDLPGVLAFSKTQPVLWICLAMVVGTLLGIALFWKHLSVPWAVISRGAEGAILPLINTGAVIGFGGVVKNTQAFSWFSGLMIDSTLPPLLSASLSINIMAGIVGSASGGLGIFMQTLGQRYIEAGVNPETLHRIVTIGSGGLDSLPHSGAVISFLTVLGLTHREAYKDIAVVSVLVPLIALGIILAGLAMMGIR
ncbi:MAG: GntP family permease [Pirellulaceae bacterium]|nr:GntP family permease [Pirellulaceae bacterium]